jgi:hypothetical protein
MYDNDVTITHFIRSRGSSVNAAADRYIGVCKALLEIARRID